MAKIKTLIESGFYFFIILLPWQTRLIWQDASLNGYVWEYGRFSLYGTELLLWLILFCYGFWLIKTRHLVRLNFNQFIQQLKKPAALIYWLIVLFFIIAGWSVVWSLDRELAYYSWFRLLAAGAMLSLILTFKFSFKKIAASWVAGAAIQGVFASWQFFSQYVFANKWLGLAEHLPTVPGAIILQTDSERWLRAYGSLPHPNILAGFLVIAVLFLLYLAFIAEKASQRVFVLVGLVAIIPALFFSFSRSAWLALIFSLVVLGFWLWRHKNYFWQSSFFKILFLILIMVGVLGGSLYQPLLTRITGEQDLEAASIELRLAFTKQALELIKADWLWGQGIGNYTLAVWQKIDASWPGYYYQPVHNIYLLISAELGIFGALAFGLILILLIWFLITTKAEGANRQSRLNEAGDSRLSLEKIIIFLCLSSILIIGLFDHYFWTLYFGVMIFWLIVGLNLKLLKSAD